MLQNNITNKDKIIKDLKEQISTFETSSGTSDLKTEILQLRVFLFFIYFIFSKIKP